MKWKQNRRIEREKKVMIPKRNKRFNNKNTNNHIKHINIKSNKRNYYNANFPSPFFSLSLSPSLSLWLLLILINVPMYFSLFFSLSLRHFVFVHPKFYVVDLVKFAFVITSNCKRKTYNEKCAFVKFSVDQFESGWILAYWHCFFFGCRASQNAIDVSLFDIQSYSVERMQALKYAWHE